MPPAGILDQLRAAARAWMAVPRVRHPRSRRLRSAQRQHLADVAGVSHPVVRLAHRHLRRAIALGLDAAGRSIHAAGRWVGLRWAEAKRLFASPWMQWGSIAAVTIGGTALQPRAENAVAVGSAAIAGLALGAVLVLVLERLQSGRSRPA